MGGGGRRGVRMHGIDRLVYCCCADHIGGLIFLWPFLVFFCLLETVDNFDLFGQDRDSARRVK